ncbi:MAG: hypothetical protein ACKO7W_14085, partial [Elainella sp.]
MLTAISRVIRALRRWLLNSPATPQLPPARSRFTPSQSATERALPQLKQSNRQPAHATSPVQASTTKLIAQEAPASNGTRPAAVPAAPTAPPELLPLKAADLEGLAAPQSSLDSTRMRVELAEAEPELLEITQDKAEPVSFAAEPAP